MTNKGSLRLGRVALIVAILCALEGISFLADLRWSFRQRLLNAFNAATRNESADDALWVAPDRPFEPGYRTFRQYLRFRVPGSSNPTGEAIDPRDLPPGKRVIVLGESAVFGVGGPAEQTFAALLDERLKPGTRVLNAGQVGADTWLVMDAGAQILQRYQPSTLVIFTGNNPWIFWSPVQQQRWNPWLIRVLSVLAKSRALAGIEFLLIRQTLLHARPTAAGFQDHYEMVGSRYALKHPLEPSARFKPADWLAVKQKYLQRFETSLEQLVKNAQARGVGVILVTIPFNYRLAPAWKHPQFEAFDVAHAEEVRGLLREAGRLVQVGDCRSALPIVDRALQLDPLPPLLHYLQAQCLERLGRLDEAEAAYAQSREKMIGNLGSRLSVNDVIRRVAGRFEVALVDAVEIFVDYERANGQHFNEQLVVDDCHLSAMGHRLIADALAPLL